MGLRLGLLSSARINAKLMAGARLVDEVDVVALASRDPERARAGADALGIERAHGSYEALLEDPDVDAVYVPLPNSLHVEWSVRALEAGKHVLCEKPMSRSVADGGARLRRRRERRPRAERGVHVAPPPPGPAGSPSCCRASGELRLVRAAFSFPLGDESDVRLSAELDGGALMDVGCYCVSGARLRGRRAAGRVGRAGDRRRRRGRALQRRDELPGRRAGALRLRHRHGDARRARGGGLRGIAVPGRSLALARAADRAARAPTARWSSCRPSEADPYACELRDFAAAVAGERPPLLGRADAVGQARTLAALYESAASGRVVPLP